MVDASTTTLTCILVPSILGGLALISCGLCLYQCNKNSVGLSEAAQSAAAQSAAQSEAAQSASAAAQSAAAHADYVIKNQPPLYEEPPVYYT